VRSGENRQLSLAADDLVSRPPQIVALPGTGRDTRGPDIPFEGPLARRTHRFLTTVDTANFLEPVVDTAILPVPETD
jgi:hypothetical protein